MVAVDEEATVAELELLGIRYLSRQTRDRAVSLRPPDALIADLVRQPSARVRGALIALFLAHPRYSAAVSDALERLSPSECWDLQVLYTAAMLLQQEHTEALRPHLTTAWLWLPDLYSKEIGVPTEGTPQQRLVTLGERHRSHTRKVVNWVGTFEKVIEQFLRSRKLEAAWSH
jgi:hypothetical protein